MSQMVLHKVMTKFANLLLHVRYWAINDFRKDVESRVVPFIYNSCIYILFFR